MTFCPDPLPSTAVTPFTALVNLHPRWGAADVEVMVPSAEYLELFTILSVSSPESYFFCVYVFFF